MTLEPRDRVLVLGVTGSGKTHFVKHEVVARCPRVVVWDVHGEYATADGHGYRPLERVTLDELGGVVDDPACRVAVVPEWAEPEELWAEFRDFAALIKESRDLVCVVDEVGLLSSGGSGSGGAMGRLVMLATQSRHWRVPLVMAAQRAVQVHPTAREQALTVVSHAQVSPRDLDALRDRGFSDEDVRRIPTLAQGERVVWRQTARRGGAGGGK